MSEKPPFYVSAAKYSWAAPLGAMLINFVFLLLRLQPSAAGQGDDGRRLIVSSICALLVVSGLVLGIVALFGVGKHGAKGILIPAVIGIVINLLLIIAVSVTIMNVRALRQRKVSAAVTLSYKGPSSPPRLITLGCASPTAARSPR